MAGYSRSPAPNDRRRTGLGLLDIRAVSQGPGERRRELTSVAPSSGAARMPRPPRLHVPGGAITSVILRGNHCEPLRLETHPLSAS